jgi:pimeloyl-ACP methyl ester carboxylesterase
MDIILIAGLWLNGSAWTGVATELERLGHSPRPLNLPGQEQGQGSAVATLEDQLAVILTAVDSAVDPVVVGHSAACSLAWLGADRRPAAVRRVVMIGGFPGSDGDAYADFFPTKDGAMPFPGWDAFEGPDSADLDEAMRQRIAANAIPVPAAVAKDTVRLSDSRRFDVPVTLVCPEFTPQQAKAAIDGGEVPELFNARDVSFVDIDSGHWPMFTRPIELARLLDDIARQGAVR